MAADDLDRTQPDRTSEPVDRRLVLGGLGAAAGAVAWAAPSIRTVAAAAAATQPPLPPVASFYQSESVSGSSSLAIQLMNLNLPVLLVVGVAARGTTTGTISDPAWDLAGSRSTLANGSGVMAVYTKPAAAGTESVTFDVTGNVNAVAFMLAYAGGTGREPAGAQTFNGDDGSQFPSADAITTTGPSRVAVYVSAWLTAAGSPTPAGFTDRGTVTNGGISLLVADQDVPVAATVGPTSADLGATTSWDAGLIAVF